MQLHVLVIDDDPLVLETLRDIAHENHQFTFVATSLKEGIRHLAVGDFDLALLNPKIDGASGDGIVRSIRASSNIPLIVLCEHPSEEEKAYYVDAGAEACMSKPLNAMEFKTRSKAILRLAQRNHDSTLRCGRLSLSLNDFTVCKDGRPIPLTKTEFAILKLLIEEPERVFTKAELFKNIWDYEDIDNGNIINVHIRRMRIKIEDDPANPKILLTKWGFGYQIGNY